MGMISVEQQGTGEPLLRAPPAYWARTSLHCLLCFLP